MHAEPSYQKASPLTLADLQKFCSTYEDRPFSHPFSQGDFTWATNGHILVRVPKLDDAIVSDNPDVLKLWADTDTSRPLMPFTLKLPPLTEKTEECETCDGSGKLHKDCPDCGCACEECDAKGEVLVSSDDDQYDQIGTVWFARHYLRLISQLPGLSVEAEPKSAMPMHFTFDGGEGLLMPVRK